jgi:hypothetical protein
MTTLWISIIAFALAALGGLTMLALRLADRRPPMPLAILHGLGAVTGVVCLAITVAGGHARGLATYALIGFCLAAVGGSYLFSMHLRDRTHPVALILGHGSIAVVSFALLLVAVLR